MITRAFFDRPVLAVCHDLIGAHLHFEGSGGPIVEVEAYDQNDPASHSFRGPTPRNAAMFGPPGHAYIYKIYGIHLCLNFVCQRGSAVLVRALKPEADIGAMHKRRGGVAEKQLCSGPGKLAQALGITIAHNGLPLDQWPFMLLQGDEKQAVATGTRIGISKAIEAPWRFVAEGSPYLSKPLPARTQSL